VYRRAAYAGRDLVEQLRCEAPDASRLAGMATTAEGDLVNVTTDREPVEGIVFETPSAKKVVVVVADPTRGPVFRTVHPKALSARATESADDRALRLLIRRTPRPDHRPGCVGSSAGFGRAGHSRGATHRTSDH
jgi:hypothetical protein